MKRIPLKGGSEYDALTGWRRLINSLRKPGKKKAIQKGYNKRFRKAVKADTLKQTEE